MTVLLFLTTYVLGEKFKLFEPMLCVLWNHSACVVKALKDREKKATAYFSPS
jgi:hypothetical protein